MTPEVVPGHPVRNRPVETAGAGSRMSPLRQPRRSVSNAMGAVSSITEDFVAFPSNCGPDRRHLHDGGTQAHRKLEFRPRTGQNHIRLPQLIPLITRNMNPNGKSRLTSLGSVGGSRKPVPMQTLESEKFPGQAQLLVYIRNIIAYFSSPVSQQRRVPRCKIHGAAKPADLVFDSRPVRFGLIHRSM